MSSRAPRRVVAPAGWVALAAVLATTLLAAWLRLPGLDQPGLWLDEILGVFRARTSPFTTSWATGTDPQHGPLFHGLLWVADVLHPTDGGYRFTFAVLGTLTVPLAFVLARDLAGRTAGVLAAALVACAPLHVYLSREARPYSLLVFLQALAMVAASRQYADGPSRWWRSALLCANVLLILASSQGIWYVLVGLATYAVTLLYLRPNGLRPVASTLAVNAVVSSLLFFAIHGYVFLNNPDVVGTPPITADFVARMFSGMVTGLQEHLPVAPAGHVAAIVSAVSALVLLAFRPRAALVACAAGIAGVVLPFVLLSYADHGLRVRYMLAGVVPLALLVGGAGGALIDRVANLAFRGAPAGPLVSAVVAFALTVPIFEYHRPLIDEAASYKPDWKRVALLLEDQAQPGDLVLTSNDWARVNLLYHLPQGGRHVELVSADGSVEKAKQLLAGRPLAFLISGGFHANDEILRWQATFPELMAHRNDTIRVNFFPDRDTLLARRPSMRRVASDERTLRGQLAGMIVPGRNTDAFLVEGWGELEGSGPRDWFRWLGKRARVYVPVAAAPPSAVRIEATSFGALGSGQRLTVRLNDRDVWTGVLPGGPLDVDLPHEFWRRGGNFLDLEFTLAGRPVDLQPGSGDTRELAAAVTALTFRW